MSTGDNLRQHVSNALSLRGAHADPDAVLKSWPASKRGVKPAGLPYTPWQVLEHMRIAQWDILEYSRNPKHVSPAYPHGYWPAAEAPPTATAWSTSVRAFRLDLKQMRALIADRNADLLAPLPRAPQHTLLREALLVAAHNSYHLGELVVMRRALGTWPPR